MFFHYLDILQVNAYVLYKAIKEEDVMNHKDFIMEFINELLGHAQGLQWGITRSSSRSRSPSPGIKKKRMARFTPSLPEDRFVGDPEDHVQCMKPAKTFRRCVYCSYLASLYRISGSVKCTPRRTRKYCIACCHHLCDAHFADFHDKENPLVVAV